MAEMKDMRRHRWRAPIKLFKAGLFNLAGAFQRGWSPGGKGGANKKKRILLR